MAKPLLMIPGPVEVDSDVLAALARPQTGHVAPKFVEAFGACLDDLQNVFDSPDGQPFVVAGSGTLAMEMAVANVIEPGDRVVVAECGYFAHRMAGILRRHGAQVDMVCAPVGDFPAIEDVEAALKPGAKALAITHVDTSTGVVSPVQKLAALAQQYGALSIVDGVCSIGGQEFHQDAWGVDIALTASQKALATPPGLALVMANPRALEAFHARKAPVASYYADWGQWLPVMQAYQGRKPAYFATPPVNLIFALYESVRQILAEGLQARWERHLRVSNAFKAGAEALGLQQVPVRPELQAVTLTTMFYPEGVDSSLLKSISAAGVVVAGGLHPEIATRSFRVGHMGVDGIAEVLQTLAAIEQGLGKSGLGIASAQASWLA